MGRPDKKHLGNFDVIAYAASGGLTMQSDNYYRIKLCTGGSSPFWCHESIVHLLP